jgi:hypothetical protein
VSDCKCDTSALQWVVGAILIVLILSSGLHFNCSSVGTNNLDYAAWSHARGAR